MEPVYAQLEKWIETGWNPSMILEYNKEYDTYRSDPEFIRIKKMAKELNDKYTRKYGITPIPKKL